jgi:YVTN family beta-propeller protein
MSRRRQCPHALDVPRNQHVLPDQGPGKGAHGVAISKDGRYVFVTNIETATLSVIDTASIKVVATHRVGAGPNGVTLLE